MVEAEKPKEKKKPKKIDKLKLQKKDKKKRELTAEQNALVQAKKNKEKKLDTERLTEVLQANMETAADEETVTRLALGPLVMEATLVAY
ncbi:MAG TPA: hypothetical protein VGO47_00285 [Chlamydiales bacterium]|nr:hypothetical protein [Chlamydiales bacterium]